MLAVIGVVLMIAITLSFLKMPFTRLAWKRGGSARSIILAHYGGMVTFAAGSPSPRKLCWRSDRAQVYASAQRRADLSGLPHTWLNVSDAELLHDEGPANAARLGAAGVPVQLHLVLA